MCEVAKTHLDNWNCPCFTSSGVALLDIAKPFVDPHLALRGVGKRGWVRGDMQLDATTTPSPSPLRIRDRIQERVPFAKAFKTN